MYSVFLLWHYLITLDIGCVPVVCNVQGETFQIGRQRGLASLYGLAATGKCMTNMKTGCTGKTGAGMC